MLNVDPNGIVTVSKGDTFSLTLFINAGSDLRPIRYDMKEADYLYFAIEEPNQLFEQAAVMKRIQNPKLDDHNNIIINFESSDTYNLCPGDYFYEIIGRFQEEDGTYSIITIIEKTPFVIIN